MILSRALCGQNFKMPQNFIFSYFFFSLKLSAETPRHLMRSKLLPETILYFTSSFRWSYLERDVVKISKYLKILFFPHFFFGSIFRQNAPTFDSFKIASRNILFFNSSSWWSYLRRYVVKISKCLKIPFFAFFLAFIEPLQHLTRSKLLPETYFFLTSRSRLSYLGYYVVKILKCLEILFFRPKFFTKNFCRMTPKSETFEIAFWNLIPFESSFWWSYLGCLGVKISNYLKISIISAEIFRQNFLPKRPRHRTRLKLLPEA